MPTWLMLGLLLIPAISVCLFIYLAEKQYWEDYEEREEVFRKWQKTIDEHHREWKRLMDEGPL